MENIENTLKDFQENLIKELWGVINPIVGEKIKEIFGENNIKALEENAKTLEDIKEEMKDLKEKAFNTKKDISQEEVKWALVNIFKDVNKAGTVTEEGFKDILEKNIKTLATEWTWSTGGNLIFDQFQKDIIKVMEQYDLVSKLKFINLTKWDRMSLPTVTNGITTAYVDQGTAWTDSEVTFGKVDIDINKTYSAVYLTEEMFDNMTNEDIYNLIVEMIGESQAQFIENEVLNWDWTKMTWISNLAGAIVVRLSTTSVQSLNDDTIIDTQSGIKRKYLRNGSVGYIMNTYIQGILRKLRTSDGRRLYPELRWENPKLDWYPVIISDDAGDIFDSATDLADKNVMFFWNLKYYQMLRRKDLSVEKGYVNDGFLKWVEVMKWTQRIGWAATIEEAFLIVKTKA